jgi:hypothetical protein
MKKKTAQSKKPPKKGQSFFLKEWWLFLFGLIILLKIPLLFEPFTYADEGIYLTLGQAIKKGLILYRDIHDNKPPLIYLLAAVTGSFSAYRLIYFLWSLGAIFVFNRLASLLFPQKPKAVILTTSLFAILASLPMFEGNIANAENFMLLPIMAGFYLILRFLKIQKKKVNKFSWAWFAAGCFFSLGVLFKVPAIFDFLAAILVCLLLLEIKNFKDIFLKLISSLIGFLFPLLGTFVFFGFKQALGFYLSAAFAQNLPYLSSWGNQQVSAGGFSSGFLIRFLIMGFLILALFIFRKKLSLALKVIIVWFATSLFAALLSGRPYPHYLLEVLPAFSLSFGLLLGKKGKFLKAIPLVFLGFFVFIFYSFHFWYYPNLPYFKNFYQYVLRLKSKSDYLAFFNPQADDLYQTADFIRSHTLPNEKIFIWGTQPSIYALSGRLPVGRYTVSYHVFDFKGEEETLGALRFQPPRWLILTDDEKRDFPQLDFFVTERYSLFQNFGRIKIFYLLPQSS